VAQPTYPPAGQGAWIKAPTEGLKGFFREKKKTSTRPFCFCRGFPLCLLSSKWSIRLEPDWSRGSQRVNHGEIVGEIATTPCVPVKKTGVSTPQSSRFRIKEARGFPLREQENIIWQWVCCQNQKLEKNRTPASLASRSFNQLNCDIAMWLFQFRIDARWQ